MGEFASLSKVEDVRMTGKSHVFPTVLVYVVNFCAMNPFPQKCFYLCCPSRIDIGHVYAKSMEFGPHCDHNMLGEPIF